MSNDNTNFKSTNNNYLESYISLLEKRIISLVPNHPLPVKEEHFGNKYIEDLSISNVSLKKISELQIEKESLKRKLNEVTQENSYLKGKLNSSEDYLKEETVSNTNLTSKPKIKLIVKSNQSLNTKAQPYETTKSFPNVESLTNDTSSRIATTYNSLRLSYLTLLQEKEKTTKAFKDEIIKNEEQRSYIEVLKDTIDSNILKHGLSTSLNLQRTYFKDSNCSNIDMLIDINKLLKQIEENNKEVNKLEIIINELRQEQLVLHKEREEYQVKYQRIKQVADSYNLELIKVKNDKSILEKEMECLQKDNKHLINTKEKLGNQQKQEEDKVKEYEKENYELQRKINSLLININSQDKLDKENQKLNDDIMNYNHELDLVIKENNTKEVKIQFLIRENNDFKDEIKKKEECLTKIKADNSKVINSQHLEINRLSHQITKLEKIITEKELIITEKDKENKRNIDKIVIYERQNLSMNDKITFYEKEINRKEIENENKISKIEIQLKENQINKEGIVVENEKVTMENTSLKNEIKNKLYELTCKDDEILFLNKEINSKSNYIVDVNQMIKNADSLNNQLEIQNDKLKKEIKAYKEKYDKEILFKNEEISRLIKSNSELKNQISDLICSLNDRDLQYNMIISERDDIKIEINNQLLKNNKLEDQIKEIIILEQAIKKQKQELNWVNSEFNKTKSDYERSKQLLEVTNKEKYELEDSYRHLKQVNTMIDNDLSSERALNIDISKKYDLLKECLIEKDNLILQYKNKINIEESNIESSNMTIKDLNSKIIHYKTEISLLEREKQKENQEKNQILLELKEIQMKNMTLNEVLNDMNIRINSTIEEILQCLYNFKSNNNNNNLYKNNQISHHFENFINFVYSLKPIDRMSLDDKLTIIKDIKSTCLNEISCLFDLVSNLESQIVDKSSEIHHKESNLISQKIQIEKFHQNEKGILSKIKTIDEEYKRIQEGKIISDDKILHITKENKDLKEKLLISTEHLKQKENESNKLTNIINSYASDLNLLNEEVDKCRYNISNLENRILILMKELKFYSSLINTISKNHIINEISLIVNKILSNIEELLNLEKEKIKINNKSHSIEKDLTKESIINNLSLKESLLNELKRNENSILENKSEIIKKSECILRLEGEIRDICYKFKSGKVSIMN